MKQEKQKYSGENINKEKFKPQATLKKIKVY